MHFWAVFEILSSGQYFNPRPETIDYSTIYHLFPLILADDLAVLFLWKKKVHSRDKNSYQVSNVARSYHRATKATPIIVTKFSAILLRWPAQLSTLLGPIPCLPPCQENRYVTVHFWSPALHSSNPPSFPVFFLQTTEPSTSPETA